MASARVEQLLDETARLSREEQAELLRDLPRVLQPALGHVARLSTEAVRQALETRERVRRRLAVARRSPGSINADLDEVRDGRLEALLASGEARDQAQ
jgi:hypothetical protein